VSDPYIVLAYAKVSFLSLCNIILSGNLSVVRKPQYSTRITLGDLNPCFEEMTAMLMT